MIGAVAVGVGLSRVVSSRGVARSGLWGGGVGLILVAPIPVAAVGLLVLAVRRFRRAASLRRRGLRLEGECLEAGELVALGLAAGLSVAGAHLLAARHAPELARAALWNLVRSMESIGVAVALADDSGPTAKMSQVLSSAATAGAPALPALQGFLDEEHHRRHTAQVEADKRLPVRLLLPLTLLVLPGFVVMIVGPTVIDSLSRLAGP